MTEYLKNEDFNTKIFIYTLFKKFVSLIIHKKHYKSKIVEKWITVYNKDNRVFEKSF